MLEVGRKMRQVFEEEELDSGDFLRKFLLGCQRLRSVPEDVVRKVLYFGDTGGLSCPEIGRCEGGKRRRGRSEVRKQVGKKRPKPNRL